MCKNDKEHTSHRVSPSALKRVMIANKGIMIAVAKAIIHPTPSAHPGNLYPSYDIPR